MNSISLHPNKISHSCVVYIIIGSALTFLATLSVMARFFSRIKTVKFWWDDWVMLSALVFAYGFLTTALLISKVGGAGYHIAQYDLNQLRVLLKVCFPITDLTIKRC